MKRQLIPNQVRQQHSVRKALERVRAISGSLSQTAIEEYLELWNIMEQIKLTDQPDRLDWRWTPEGIYSAKSAYTMLHNGAIAFRGHRLIRKTWALL